jgi:bilirubin oxidase
MTIVPSTIWYHDHTLGMTRVTYAGSRFYLLRGRPDQVQGKLPDPPSAGRPSQTKYYEIPIAIQDHLSSGDGSRSPDTREFFDQFAGLVHPRERHLTNLEPEFFGNTIVVNGWTCSQ